MQQNYQDAMAIMRSIHKRPDLFITMTCNPKWKEYKILLKNYPVGTTINSVPSLADRLFNLKYKSLLKDIVEKQIFGKVLSYISTVEFQKRGLPHVHLIVTLHPDNSFNTFEDIDKHICAEIPVDDKHLQKLVIKYMLHGPHTPKTPCYVENQEKCKKKFPKNFQYETQFQKNGYPLYRRRKDESQIFYYKNANSNIKIPVNNSMVVPYNPFLLKKYKCHINVEYCASIQSIKYIFDYLHKGSDRAYCKIEKITNKKENVTEIHDELTQYIDGRYLSPMEACWRFEEFPLCDRSHSVVRLAVHTENQQNLVFEENKEAEALLKGTTTLTAWFDLNKNDTFAQKIKYINIPTHYKFNKITKIWEKRKKGQKFATIGRLNVVSPKDNERFFLKLILNRVKGVTSFKDIRTYENITYNTYKETAIAMGLIETDKQIFKIFEEACTIMLPYQLRKYFAWFILSENIDGRLIILNSEDKSCVAFGLPEPDEFAISEDDNESHLEYQTLYYKYDKLNEEQKLIFENIITNTKKIFYIDGPGGSGRTSHRTFKLPLNLEDTEIIFFKSQKDKRKLRDVDIIIWDEASMIPKCALEIVNKTLQDINQNELPFGGKTIILGGDFHQILPVVKHGNKNKIVEETIKFSKLWKLFNIMKLSKNMRSNNPEFSSFLLSVGCGEIINYEIPDQWKTDDVCKKIFSNINDSINSYNSVILSSHNEHVDMLNNRVLKLLKSDSKCYYSIDCAIQKGVDQTEEDIHLSYPIEMLNDIREGLPPHKLELKVNAIVILIRNLSIQDGLCNGTRLKILKLFEYNIECEIITGECVGNKVFIPRITLNSGETSHFPFVLYRKQFPLKLAFAMTINKSQGQSFDNLGLYFKRTLFSHGQLYVALSRCKDPNNIWIENSSTDNNFIKNIVWKEALE
uniref:ATP-dependent DNA helicase n=1 Tax=Trichogramma kaykai TaxID=54128 RepID=A0ABD2XAK4_9HYME